MTTLKFDATPTPSEGISLDEISADKVKEAWKGYEAKPEYKKFNKHDMIESMQHAKDEEDAQADAP
ncbi:NF038105 family protein [Acinetobacter indicus]|uniref:NF038105 family protein n=1 Tax=Acinetobacter indicus TaxID=756892 RepID=UPI00257872A1|nr:NF038105 family protein [Acinetobacter indicus]MDM1303424.1 NF038105 family protein [Acinetobacter indicus]